MTRPAGKRVRVLGDLYHGRIPDGAVYVGRSAPGLKASPFANPFTLKKHGPTALTLFAEYLDSRPDLIARVRNELAGHDLACWCRLGQPCHADLLLDLVNREEKA